MGIVKLLREAVEHTRSDDATRYGYELADRLDVAAAELESAEPVAWASVGIGGSMTRITTSKQQLVDYWSGTDGIQIVPLYRHPPTELAVPEWQPIETAPRDGRQILLGIPETESHGGASVIGYWLDALEDGSDYMGHDAGFTDMDYQVFTPSRLFGAVSHQSIGSQPTHWMPLPEAPGAGGGE